MSCCLPAEKNLQHVLFVPVPLVVPDAQLFFLFKCFLTQFFLYAGPSEWRPAASSKPGDLSIVLLHLVSFDLCLRQPSTKTSAALCSSKAPFKKRFKFSMWENVKFYQQGILKPLALMFGQSGTQSVTCCVDLTLWSVPSSLGSLAQLVLQRYLWVTVSTQLVPSGKGTEPSPVE